MDAKQRQIHENKVETSHVASKKAKAATTEVITAFGSHGTRP